MTLSRLRISPISVSTNSATRATLKRLGLVGGSSAKPFTWAIKELADRLDGRPKQTNVLEASDEHELRTIMIIFVSPNGREADDMASLNMFS